MKELNCQWKWNKLVKVTVRICSVGYHPVWSFVVVTSCHCVTQKKTYNVAFYIHTCIHYTSMYKVPFNVCACAFLKYTSKMWYPPQEEEMAAASMERDELVTAEVNAHALDITFGKYYVTKAFPVSMKDNCLFSHLSLALLYLFLP